jgi:hypothetical protein
MSYVVEWDDEAERELIELWLGSRMRHAIRMAADQIDVALGLAPYESGESRDGNHRIMLVAPLGVLFRVDDQMRKVIVLSVWSF